MKYRAHLDTTHKLLADEMLTFGGRQVLHIVADDGKEQAAAVGYSCCIRGVDVFAFDLSRNGGILPDWLLVAPALGRVLFVEAKSPASIRKKKELLQAGQRLLSRLVGSMFQVYETQEQARRLLLSVTDNADYDER